MLRLAKPDFRGAAVQSWQSDNDVLSRLQKYFSKSHVVRLRLQ